MMHKKFRCACCGYFTLEEGHGSYEVCPVCFWEDDKLQNKAETCIDGANQVCLQEAKQNFMVYGACEERFSALVREPMEEELGYADDM